jgi:hypothetical protein
MKSYNHLWEIFISDENIDLAVKNASKGKRNRKSVKKRLDDPNFKAQIKAYAENFKNKPHTPKQIYDGIQRKKRTIIVPDFDEQVIHHMIVNVLKPIFYCGMYEHSYGSVPGRGGYKGMLTVKKWISHGGKNCKYILKMDIKKYFDSIPHDIYLSRLRKLIHDERFYSILEEITSVTNIGIPLGFYTSQWTANWYLQGLDHYIKEDLGAKYYIRYMDDMVIFGSNKKNLHEMRKNIEAYLNDNLGLKLKENWQVFKFDYNGKYRFLDFMGFRFYRNRITLRRLIMIKATQKARRIYKAKKITVFCARQMLSYLGWIKATDTYGMYLNWIKPVINFQQLKRKIRAHDKNNNRRIKNELVQERIRNNAA